MSTDLVTDHLARYGCLPEPRDRDGDADELARQDWADQIAHEGCPCGECGGHGLVSDDCGCGTPCRTCEIEGRMDGSVTWPPCEHQAAVR